MQPTNTNQAKVSLPKQTETLVLSRREYDALSDIYGLEPTVHSMVMLARPDQDGDFLLTGDEHAFEALQSDLFEEIYNEMSSTTKLRQLKKIYRRLCPDGDL